MYYPARRDIRGNAMNRCGKYEDLVARYLHGELLLPEREELESHLSVCPDCERLYREVTDLDRLLRELPGKSVEPPPYLHARILTNLPEEGEGEVVRRRWWGWAAGLSAAAACLLLAFALYRGDVRTGDRVASLPPGGTGRPAVQSPAIPGPAPAPKAEQPPPGQAPAVASAPRVQVIREVRVYFYYPPARQVSVTGDFNNWNPDGVPLRPTGKPGLWETTLRLRPGAYSYNFIVDGNYLVPDPNAPAQAPDGYGGTNSILLVRGDSA
ncbi:MAG: hypothetical protein Kow00128_16770 [Deltaproteobacteria bacterium]